MKKFFILLAIFLFPIEGKAQQALVTPTETEIVNVRATDFQKLLQASKKAQLIDIRTAREYQMGHIKGAININFYDPDFRKNIEKAGLNKNQPIFIYCRSGNRSSHALKTFRDLGFKKIIHLVYGINDWYRSGLELTK